MEEPFGKHWFSVKSVSSSLEKCFLSGSLYIGALYALTLIAQIKLFIVLVRYSLVSMVRDVSMFCSAV